MARTEVPMSVRRAIIEADTARMNVAEFCRPMVSAPGSSGICAGATPARATPCWSRSRGRRIIRPGARRWRSKKRSCATRKELDRRRAGTAGPASIAPASAGLAGLPHESTIWRILTARGPIVADPSRRPSTGGSFTAERANECWALDDWTWDSLTAPRCKILDVLDDHSRYAVACTAMPTCTGAAAFDVIATAASCLGWPQRFWSDNARAFTGTLAAAVGAARCGRQPHPALQPAQQRQGRTIPPDRATVAHQTTTRRHHRRPASPARPVPPSSTTPSDHTAHSIAASRPTSGPPPPRADPPTGPWPPPPACTTAPSTPPRPTPAATPSPSAPPTTATTPSPSSPAPTPTSSSTDNSSATSPSTPTRRTQPLYPRLGRPTLTERKDPRHA